MAKTMCTLASLSGCKYLTLTLQYGTGYPPLCVTQRSSLHIGPEPSPGPPLRVWGCGGLGVSTSVTNPEERSRVLNT